MKIKITKLEERTDAEHPNNIPEGWEKIKEFPDEWFREPQIGKSFTAGGFMSSIVQEIIDENTFKTLNSVYRWEIIEGKKPERVGEINGKYYPMWSQFVERKEVFIGCDLEDWGDPMDRALFAGEMPAVTKVKDIELKPNGEDSAFFAIIGEDFDCGSDVKHVGITGGEEGYLTFVGYGGHEYRIKLKE